MLSIDASFTYVFDLLQACIHADTDRSAGRQQTHPNGTTGEVYLKALEPLRSIIPSLPHAHSTGQDNKKSKSTTDLNNMQLDDQQPGGEVILSDPKDVSHYDPDAYKRYKRRLRAAVLECYKGLELLKNFRILNMTGFRKSLKKFEKTSGVHLAEAYMNDKISKRLVSSSVAVDDLIEEIEALYAARFGELLHVYLQGVCARLG